MAARLGSMAKSLASGDAVRRGDPRMPGRISHPRTSEVIVAREGLMLHYDV